MRIRDLNKFVIVSTMWRSLMVIFFSGPHVTPSICYFLRTFPLFARELCLMYGQVNSFFQCYCNLNMDDFCASEQSTRRLYRVNVVVGGRSRWMWKRPKTGVIKDRTWSRSIRLSPVCVGQALKLYFSEMESYFTRNSHFPKTPDILRNCRFLAILE